MINGMRLPAGVLILSFVFSSSYVFAETKQSRIEFKLFTNNKCNGEKIDYSRMEEIISGINDSTADSYLEKRGNWRRAVFVSAMMTVVGLCFLGPISDNASAEKIIIVSSSGLLGISLFCTSVSLYYEHKAIDRYNAVIGESNKSSLIFLNPKESEHNIGLQYSF